METGKFIETLQAVVVNLESEIEKIKVKRQSLHKAKQECMDQITRARELIAYYEKLDRLYNHGPEPEPSEAIHQEKMREHLRQYPAKYSDAFIVDAGNNEEKMLENGLSFGEQIYQIKILRILREKGSNGCGLIEIKNKLGDVKTFSAVDGVLTRLVKSGVILIDDSRNLLNPTYKIRSSEFDFMDVTTSEELRKEIGMDPPTDQVCETKEDAYGVTQPGVVNAVTEYQKREREKESRRIKVYEAIDKSKYALSARSIADQTDLPDGIVQNDLGYFRLEKKIQREKVDEQALYGTSTKAKPVWYYFVREEQMTELKTNMPPREEDVIDEQDSDDTIKVKIETYFKMNPFYATVSEIKLSIHENYRKTEMWCNTMCTGGILNRIHMLYGERLEEPLYGTVEMFKEDEVIPKFIKE